MRSNTPGRQAGARKAFLGFDACSFQKWLTSWVIKVQPSPSACFWASCPSSLSVQIKNTCQVYAGRALPSRKHQSYSKRLLLDWCPHYKDHHTPNVSNRVPVTPQDTFNCYTRMLENITDLSTCFQLWQLWFCIVDQIVWSHNSNGSSSDHQSLKHFRIKVLSFFGWGTQVLNGFT